MPVIDSTSLELHVIKKLRNSTLWNCSQTVTHNVCIMKMRAFSKKLNRLWRKSWPFASVQGRISQVNFLFFCINGINLSQQNASGLRVSALLKSAMVRQEPPRTGLYANFSNIKVWIWAELLKQRNWFNQYTRNPNFKIQTINLDISRDFPGIYRWLGGYPVSSRWV